MRCFVFKGICGAMTLQGEDFACAKYGRIQNDSKIAEKDNDVKHEYCLFLFLFYLDSFNDGIL